MNALGCDVSKWQGQVDWPAARAAGLSFAWIKATQGASLVDAGFADNWLAARAAGLLVGAYHYYDHTAGPRDQAGHFAAVVQAAGLAGSPGLLPNPLALDLEETRGLPPQLESRVLEFLTHLEKLTGCRPVIYTSPGFWGSYMRKAEWADRYPLWVAHWKTPAPNVPPPWAPNRWHFWQYTASAPGAKYGMASKGLDLDLMND